MVTPDCGMTTFDNPTLHGTIKKNLGVDADGKDFGAIEEYNPKYPPQPFLSPSPEFLFSND